MMPFPTIFQARCLSTSWNARFKWIDTLSGEEKKRAMLFQSLVADSCWKWKTFCPVLISVGGDLVSYDKESNKWLKLPSVSFLPRCVLQKYSVQIEGALLYASDTPAQLHDGIFYVANILTGGWKLLPGPPVTHGVINSSKLVISDCASQSYKLILLGQRTLYYDDIHLVVIYDSVSKLWSQKKIANGDDDLMYDFRLNSVQLKGVVYTGSSYSPPDICGYNLEEGTFERLTLTVCDWLGQVDLSGAIRWQDYRDELNLYHLVVCKNQLFMLVGTPQEYEQVVKIDVGALELFELANVTVHSPSLHGRSTAMAPMAPVGDERHIWFGYRDCVFEGQYIRAYNVEERMWSNSFAVPSRHGGYGSIASMKPSWSPFLSP